MAMFFFLSGAGKRGAGDKATRAAAGLGWLVVMFFLGVDTALTNFVQQTRPPCLQSTIAPTSVPPPPDSHSPIQHTSTRQTQVQSIANRGRTPSACAGQAPSGPGSIYPGPPSSPLARIAPPPFLQRCGGSFPASPTSRRCDAAPWAAAGTVDRCNGGGGFLSMDFISDGHDLLFLSPPPILSMPTEGPQSDATPLPPPSPSHHHHHNPTLPGQQFALRIIIRGISTPLPQPIPPSPRV